MGQIGPRGARLVAGGADLGPVARRQHRRFARRSAPPERPQRLADAAGLKVQTLPQLEGRGVVAGAASALRITGAIAM